jgi:hypothetical protein
MTSIELEMGRDRVWLEARRENVPIRELVTVLTKKLLPSEALEILQELGVREVASEPIGCSRLCMHLRGGRYSTESAPVQFSPVCRD